MEVAGQGERSPITSTAENPNEILVFLSRVPLFETLPRSSLDEIVRLVCVEAYPKGTRLIRQGEPGGSFYILRTGEARVTTTSEDALESYLATLKPGDCLGEMALLTGEPRAANVTLTHESVLYTLYKDDFDRILASNPALYRHFTSLLVQRLKGSNLLVEREHEREVALSRFLHLDPSARPPQLVGRSRALQQLQARIQEVVGLDAPLILRGEKGVGRELAARMIHQMGPDQQGPFVIATCLPERRKRQTPIARDRRRRDQLACNLLGYERGAFPGAETRQIGLLELAHEGTLVIRNAEYLSPTLMDEISKVVLQGRFQRLGSTRVISVRVRVLLTWTDGQVAENEALLKRFAGEVHAREVLVPSLRDRKKDIPLLVEHFAGGLHRPGGEETPRLSKEALNRLMHYDFPGNVAELESVIKRGVLLAGGPEIFPEEILLGVPRVEGKAKYNLLRIPWIQKLLGPMDLMGVLRIAVTVGLLAMIPLAIWGLELRVAGQPLVLLLTWKIWWPLLLLSLLFAGRVWCGVCPVFTIAGITQRWQRSIPIPEAVAIWGRWVAILGFFVLAWMEDYFGLVNRPRETGFILAGVVLGAVAVGLFFQRNAWCRYLCPLGTMASVYAVASATEVRSNRSLCLSSCTDHTCYRGAAGRSGCPMYQHPLFFQDNMNCRFCFRCVSNCPHGAVQLNLRVPGEEAWTMENRPLWAAVFARLLAGFVVYQALYGLEPFRRWWTQAADSAGLPEVLSFTLLLLAPVAAVLGLFLALDALVWLRSGLPVRKCAEIFGFAVVPMALTAHLAVKVGETLGPIPATMILFERYFVHWDLTFFLQGGCIFLGAVLSLHILWRLRGWVQWETGIKGSWIAWLQAVPVAVLCMLYWAILRG
jgi:transcriptional regulator with AAA-type ATPase domain/polyferredoxin